MNKLELIQALRRLAEKNIPECAGFSFVFKAGKELKERVDR
ncbi:hypothetical protein [Desulfosarcina ovata]|nr:hypothetical protein [Desulfosarcina ovata]